PSTGEPARTIDAALYRETGAILGIHLLLHQDSGGSPSEAEMQVYFGVTPPTVHQMVLSLEKNGLIARTAGQARSIRLLLPRHELHDLEYRFSATDRIITS